LIEAEHTKPNFKKHQLINLPSISKSQQIKSNDLYLIIIVEWSLKLNKGKCRFVYYGRNSSIRKYDYSFGNEIIERTESITDLEVVIDPQLKLSLYIREKVNKAYARLGIIKIILNACLWRFSACYIKQWDDSN